MEHLTPMMGGWVALVYAIATIGLLCAHYILWQKTGDRTQLTHAVDHGIMAAAMLFAVGGAVFWAQWAMALSAVAVLIHVAKKVRDALRS